MGFARLWFVLCVCACVQLRHWALGAWIFIICMAVKVSSHHGCNLLYGSTDTDTNIIIYYYYCVYWLGIYIPTLSASHHYHGGKIVHKLRAMNFLRFWSTAILSCRIRSELLKIWLMVYEQCFTVIMM